MPDDFSERRHSQFLPVPFRSLPENELAYLRTPEIPLADTMEALEAKRAARKQGILNALLAFGIGAPVTLLDLSVELGQPLQELLDFAADQAGRNQALHFDVIELQLQPNLAAEDDELARHVHARQIVARIGLGVTFGLRFAHDGRERNAAVVDIEQIRQRAREDAFDADDVGGHKSPHGPW